MPMLRHSNAETSPQQSAYDAVRLGYFEALTEQRLIEIILDAAKWLSHSSLLFVRS